MAFDRKPAQYKLTERDRLLLHSKLTPKGCWEWQLSLDSDGYATIKVGGVTRTAHRRAYAIFVGPLVRGLTCDHLCRNRKCINPRHLEQVTTQINTRRGIRASQTECWRGHPLSGPNLYRTKAGKRHCKACQNMRGEKFRALRRINAGV